MSKWQVQEAKARLSDLMDKAQSEGPQVISRHGKETAVVLSMDEYRRLLAERPDFNAWLLSAPKVGLSIRRRKDRPRQVPL